MSVSKAGSVAIAMKTSQALQEGPKPSWGDNETLYRVVEDLTFFRTPCCGLSMASGMKSLKSVEDVYALRRVVGVTGDKDEDRDFHARDIDSDDDIKTSLVIVTTIISQKLANKLLPQGGFEPLATFKNKNTKNTVTVWGALTI